MTNEDWKKKLTPEQYNVLREKGTEAPFIGKFVFKHDKGMYTCVACGQKLFSSSTKFDSGTGWPSFDNPVNLKHVRLQEDYSYGSQRTEVVCGKCGGHLGHLFNDGPTENKKRYCINSCALSFNPTLPRSSEQRKT